MAYVFLGLSLTTAALLIFFGIRQHIPPAIDDASAQTCCWAPKGDPTRCYPCRPTRESR